MQAAGHHNLQFAMGHTKYYLGITKFSDWTDKEFMQRYTTKMDSTQHSKPSPSENILSSKSSNQKIPNFSQNSDTKDLLSKYPDEIDFRENNAIGPIEDQGKCGACYSFASVAATEAAYVLKYNKTRTYRKLSKQQMLDCGANHTEYLRGCNGGVLEAAYSYLQEYGVSEAINYPYIGVQGKCKEKSVKSFLKVRGYNMLRNVNKDGILTMLAQKPVSMAIEVVPYMKLYEGGIIDIKGPCGFFYNHAILAVGYNIDTEFPYFILKNTYGDEWGQEGYMYYQIGIGSFGMCAAINDNASSPVL
jgi:C1A family cysteine protease